MKTENYRIYQIPVAIMLFMLILDAQTAILGAAEAVDLCIRTVIPSLFPFIFISGFFRMIWQNATNPILKLLGKLCKLPTGSENLFLLGIIGGYPVGAKCVYDSYCDKTIDYNSANRILCFCNNAGPAFIIGIVGSLFARDSLSICIWVIQIMSAIIVGAVLPVKNAANTNEPQVKKTSITILLQNAIRAVANICGWVIIFRVLLVVLNKWVLWLLPDYLQVTLAGTLELTNGILMLSIISSPYLQFILANIFLSLGGLCIALQTKSMAPIFDYTNYYIGKLLQASVCLILSSVIGFIYFPGNNLIICTISIVTGIITALIFYHFLKRTGKMQRVDV